MGETTKNRIRKLVEEAALALGFGLPEFAISVPDAAFGDYATNAAFIIYKGLTTATDSHMPGGTKHQGIKWSHPTLGVLSSPNDLANKLIDEIIKNDSGKLLAKCESKNGFINFTLSANYLLTNLQNILSQGDLYGASLEGQGRTVVVEYFQNNVAKPPHVGHLRSAVIGDCLLRVFKSQGYKTVSDTHIGDWGVQFGILLCAYKEYIKNGGSKADLEKDPINELNKLYVAQSKKIEEHPELRDLGKQEFVKLEQGDTENRELWQWFVNVSLEDFERYRKLLGILPFDHNLGESFYEDKMPAVLKEFQDKGLVTVGESGEKYVDLESFDLGRCILVKSDGGTTYHMRDFATYIYRKKEFNFYKNIYEVDNRQSHHFRQLFKVLELAGYPALTDSVHVEHGFMSLPEGAISTRKGTTISLQNLISDSRTRALAIINEKNPDLQNKEAVAEMVALAAIKYFDLSHNRQTEITFTWEKALSFEGNTGPYLQYTYARIQSILAKAQSPSTSGQINFQTQNIKYQDSELAVLRKLVKFSEVVAQVTEDFYPNNLCNYLFELSQAFNTFYEQCPVLQEPDENIKTFRLALISATAQIIRNGLYLLGIDAVEKM